MRKPIIYQMLPRLWGNQNIPVKNGDLKTNGTGKFQNIDTVTFDYLKSLGVSHVWYTGIIRHATQSHCDGCIPSSSEWVKGDAGSPYAITNYFDVNPYLASCPDKRMEEFEDLVRRTHEAGLKVIIDFVPNHVARDYGQFSPQPIIDGKDAEGHSVLGAEDDSSVTWKEENDFFYYPNEYLRLPDSAIRKAGHKAQGYVEFPAKASGNTYTSAPTENDWYDTIKINYCEYHTSTWDKMAEIIEFWISKGVDGFRCDMVELVPAEFFKWIVEKVKKAHPQIVFIAEVYQKTMYSKYIHHVGFDYLYDKSGLYDALRAIVMKNAYDSGVPVEQWQSTRLISWNWQQLGDLQPRMLNFLENHDEQRFASSFFGADPKTAMAPLAVSLLFNTAPFMLYFGQEIGESGMDEEGMSGKDGRTTIFDWWSPASLRRLYSEIHHGKEHLLPEEREMLEKYRNLLQYAAEDSALSMGSTYDLCYCNFSSDGFNKDKHFAFLRDYEDETLLIVSNFSSTDAQIDIMIPEHAFKWLELPESDKLNHLHPVKVKVKAKDAVIIPL